MDDVRVDLREGRARRELGVARRSDDREERDDRERYGLHTAWVAYGCLEKQTNHVPERGADDGSFVGMRSFCIGSIMVFVRQTHYKERRGERVHCSKTRERSGTRVGGGGGISLLLAHSRGASGVARTDTA